MGKLVFDAAEVRRIVEHALAAPQHRDLVTGFDSDGNATTEPGKPAVILVHDEGVYLMSNGIPADKGAPASNRLFVAYARGCNPNREPSDWYDTAHDYVGETLPHRNAPAAKGAEPLAGRRDVAA